MINIYSASLRCCSIASFSNKLAKHCSRGFRNRRQKPTLAIVQLGFGGHTVNWYKLNTRERFTRQAIGCLLVVSCSIEFVFGCVRALREAYRVQLYCMPVVLNLFFAKCHFLCHSKGSKCQLNIFEVSYVDYRSVNFLD